MPNYIVLLLSEKNFVYAIFLRCRPARFLSLRYPTSSRSLEKAWGSSPVSWTYPPGVIISLSLSSCFTHAAAAVCAACLTPQAVAVIRSNLFEGKASSGCAISPRRAHFAPSVETYARTLARRCLEMHGRPASDVSVAGLLAQSFEANVSHEQRSGEQNARGGGGGRGGALGPLANCLFMRSGPFPLIAVLRQMREQPRGMAAVCL